MYFEEDSIDSFNEEQLKIIRECESMGLDSRYLKCKDFSIEQMNRVFYGLKNKLGVWHYAGPEFTPEQMDVIIGGLEMGADVSWYARSDFPADYMAFLRDAFHCLLLDQ